MSQTLYNGNRTANQVKAAEAQVLAARETLRNTEQNVLLEAATAYMNVLRDTAIVSLRRQNVEALEEQLRAVRDRFQVGEVTRTDVAQAEARLAGAQSELLLADANAKTSQAVYRRVIGDEPKRLAPGRPVERLLPKTLDACVATGLSRHPSIEAAKHGADAALLQVKVAEGSLYPTVTVEASYLRRFESSPQTDDFMTGQVVGRLSVPIYQGGGEFSTIRQSKETLGQRRLEVDVAREQVRAAVVQSWGLLEAAKAQIEASQSQVRAAEIALNGVREEARVGQRTTLDVLNAQQELLDARVNLITAQRDRVVASYQVLQTIGRLNAASLGLKVAVYDPVLHYKQVKDKWWGLRTPDGR
jgi:outer membrane protein